MKWIATILMAVSFQLSAVSQTFRAVPPPNPNSLRMRMALAAVPVTPPTNHGWNVPLVWEITNHPALAGVRIYASTNRIDWRRIAQVGLVTNCTATNISLPQSFVARYVSTNELEGPDSNLLSVLGREVVVTVRAQSSTNLAQWENLSIVYQRTNAPEAARYFRNTISAIQRFTTQ